MADLLSLPTQKWLLAYARLHIGLALEQSTLSAEEVLRHLAAPIAQEILLKLGCFVTLHTATGELRGCIGTFREEVLWQNVEEMALAAAFHDYRFNPVAREELAEIVLEISVLSPRQRTALTDIEIGKHGLWLEYNGHSGVLLPQVAVEQGWDVETFLNHTCQKAGLPAHCWQQYPVELQTFTAQIFREA